MIKKLRYILILSVFIANIAFATTQSGYLNYSNMYNFKNCNVKKILNNANSSMLRFEKATKFTDKKFYLDQAMRNYYLVTLIDYSQIDACIGLGRVYGIMNLDTLANEYFYRALSINSHDAKANFYFAEYFFSENEFIPALAYYKTAYDNGYAKNYTLNYRMGVIYEKLADIVSAKKFYGNALSINENNPILAEKIRLLDELNYDSSQYYLFSRKKLGKGNQRDR